MHRLAPVAAAAALAACTYPNDLHDARSTSATVGDGGSTTAAGASTTSDVDPSGVTDGATGEATTEATTTEATTTEDGTTAAETEAATTGEPADCWGKDPTVWEIEPLDLTPFGADPSAPRVSPDGLSLLFTAGAPGQRRVLQVSRAAVDQPFAGPQQLSFWSEGAIDHAMITNGGQELFVSAVDTEIRISLFDGGWSEPVLAAGLQSQALDRSASATEDGARIFFERDDGPPNPYFKGAASFILYEAARQPFPAPGAAFGPPAPVVLPGMTDDPNYPHLYYCAAPSPDGLRLFFASTYPNKLAPENIADALRIFYTERASLDAPWSPPIKLESLAAPGLESCAGSVTRDGCQLFFHEWLFMAPEPKAQLYVARR